MGVKWGVVAFRRHPSCGGKKRINIEERLGHCVTWQTLPNSNRHPIPKNRNIESPMNGLNSKSIPNHCKKNLELRPRIWKMSLRMAANISQQPESPDLICTSEPSPIGTLRMIVQSRSELCKWADELSDQDGNIPRNNARQRQRQGIEEGKMLAPSQDQYTKNAPQMPLAFTLLISVGRPVYQPSRHLTLPYGQSGFK